jgi:deoxyribodipyrimidine photolyase-like uncharacterized protein
MATTPGARGAVFCDPLGECVNCVGAAGRKSPGTVDDFELRVTGAQLATAIDDALSKAVHSIGTAQELVVRGRFETLLVHVLKDGYFLVVCLEPDALASRAMQALRGTAQRLMQEF